jgi:hypothetical protein
VTVAIIAGFSQIWPFLDQLSKYLNCFQGINLVSTVRLNFDIISTVTYYLDASLRDGKTD